MPAARLALYQQGIEYAHHTKHWRIHLMFVLGYTLLLMQTTSQAG